MEKRVDVVVVGAGPVGLLTAVELALGGVRVLVLERLDAASTTTKALSVGPLGGEALQRRGMAAAIAAEEAQSLAMMRAFTQQAEASLPGRGSKISGHFAGLLIRMDAQREPERRPRFVSQQGVEAMLADRARSLGIEVRRACDVIGFVEQADGIEVEWASPTGANHIRCSYLVGCDGGRSSIRKSAGFDFPGTPPTMTMYLAVAEFDPPEPLPKGFHRTSGGMFINGPLPGRLFLLDFSGPPENREAPVTREEIEAVLCRVIGADIHVKALESGSRWTDNTRLVDTYRRGRVLLAGDAAHIHPPFGGQGLSLGLVDAANLGWKLAVVIRVEMPERLLDTYTAERRPIAEAVLANTHAQAAIMRPGPQSSAMRDIVAKLMQFDDVNRFVGEMTSGLSTRYDLGSDLDDVGRLIGDKPIRHGDVNVSLYDVMQDGMGVLLDASTEAKASKLAAATTPKIRCVAVDTGPSMLIRPDACIAWAGKENSIDGLEEALRRWFIPLDDGSVERSER
jgi:2-polyprenyl-6-methoxyphenol hydroxylase-like FAD-dependent oxidoreductase